MITLLVGTKIHKPHYSQQTTTKHFFLKCWMTKYIAFSTKGLYLAWLGQLFMNLTIAFNLVHTFKFDTSVVHDSCST